MKATWTVIELSISPILQTSSSCQGQGDKFPTLVSIHFRYFHIRNMPSRALHWEIRVSASEAQKNHKSPVRIPRSTINSIFGRGPPMFCSWNMNLLLSPDNKASEISWNLSKLPNQLFLWCLPYWCQAQLLCLHLCYHFHHFKSSAKGYLTASFK